MENNAKKIRITKAMRFEDIKALLQGEVPQHTTADEAIDFINNELAILANKNRSDSKKNQEHIAQNNSYKEMILNYLAENPNDNGYTCTELYKAIPELSQYSNQKVAALMTMLFNEGKVVRNVVKNQKRFSLA